VDVRAERPSSESTGLAGSSDDESTEEIYIVDVTA
jgi:hypothetical protein